MVQKPDEAALPIIWRRYDQPGHEAARLFFENSLWHLSGTAVFIYQEQSCRLDYLISCNEHWHTLAGKVSGWMGPESIEIAVGIHSGRRWQLNGKDCPEVMGCIDLDLNFSPSTNLLPIRRLNLAIGQEAKVQAAWLRFPNFRLEYLEQIYRRVAATTYRYESAGGRFVTELQVNADGFVTVYPNFWEVEKAS